MSSPVNTENIGEKQTGGGVHGHVSIENRVQVKCCDRIAKSVVWLEQTVILPFLFLDANFSTYSIVTFNSIAESTSLVIETFLVNKIFCFT